MTSLTCVTNNDRLTVARTPDGTLDDVFVENVSMFHAEMLDKGHLWLCCYLPGTGVEGDRVTFEVRARGKALEFRLVESPASSASTDTD